jgi:mono/diheme cytochrome c family protein
MSGSVKVVAFVLVLACLAGCENSAQNMYDQAKYKPQSGSELWPDGRAARPLQPGTVAFSGGPVAGTSSGRLERTEPASGSGPQSQMYSLDALQRGRERYDIFCAPCHGRAGDGDGYITRRGFPHPPTFHEDRLRGAADSYLFAVMSRGYGAMYPYADRITPQDRWAIVGYLRALQRAQHATLDDVPAAERVRLTGAAQQ